MTTPTHEDVQLATIRFLRGGGEIRREPPPAPRFGQLGHAGMSQTTPAGQRFKPIDWKDAVLDHRH